MYTFDEVTWDKVDEVGFGARCIADQRGPYCAVPLRADELEELVRALRDLRRAIESLDKDLG